MTAKFKKNFREEQAKFRKMNFEEKRWYLWEYYKFQIGGVILAIFILGSITYAILNPSPREYLYIAWDGVPIAGYRLNVFAEELSIIVENPERQAVFITDYTTGDNQQINDNMQMRFVAMLQLNAIDVLITTYDGVQTALDVEPSRRVIRNVDSVLEYLYEINPEIQMNDRVLTHAGQLWAISLYGSPFLAQFDLDGGDVYFCVIANSRRPYEIAKALEVLLNGA